MEDGIETNSDDGKHPFLSIITPTFNRAQFIREAIESVQRQSFVDYEHIIVDGGSTDGTLDILREYPHLQVISEPDDGVYDAFNKGINRASGDVIGLLNSDDYYSDDAFEVVARIFRDDMNIDVLSGGAIVFSQTPEAGYKELRRHLFVENIKLNFNNVAMRPPLPNARFLKKRVYDRVGLFDKRFSYAADRDFLLRVVYEGVSEKVVEKPFYYYRNHTESLTISPSPTKILERVRENLEIAEKYTGERKLARESRSGCKKWHAMKITRGIEECLRNRKLITAWRLILRGISHNPLFWLYIMTKRIRKFYRINSGYFTGLIRKR